MKRLCLAFLTCFCLSSQAKAPTLTVYTYESFVGKNTLGELLVKESLAATGCETRFKVFPTINEAINQLRLEGSKTPADILVGVDSLILPQASQAAEFISPFVPFDRGILAVLHDSSRLGSRSATSFTDFVEGMGKKRFVYEDPRTSSLGKMFLIWTKMAFPEEAKFNAFWKELRKKTLTVAPSWSAAYGLFLNKEADYVLSYTTSPAYHIETDKKPNHPIRAMSFSEGHLSYSESAGILKISKNAECARKWLGLLISPPVQTQLPLLQWMYPVARVQLPASFMNLPEVKALPLPDYSPQELKKLVDAWTLLASDVK